MSSTISEASMSTDSAILPSNSIIGAGQLSQGISLNALITALELSLVIFGVQLLAFILLRNKLARIFKPKTYLVPEKERTEPPPRSPWGWLFAIFRFRDREIIRKCGLDAYFFLRYLQTLLGIFVPMAIVLLPILIPLNSVGGRGQNYHSEFANYTSVSSTTSTIDVKGLDLLAWGNVRPTRTHRYWAHLMLAILVIIWVCSVFFLELKVFIKIRQDYLTSAEHRLRASATTVLVGSIPKKWLTEEALAGLFDVFPGGLRNIWINRNFDELLEKIRSRDEILKRLEGAETELIRLAKRAQKKRLEKEEKLADNNSRNKPKLTKAEKLQREKEENARAELLAQEGGQETGDRHEVPHTIDDVILAEQKKALEQGGRKSDPSTKNTLKRLNTVGLGIGKGLGSVSKAGGTVLGGVRFVGRNLDNQLETTHGFVNIEDSPMSDEHYDQYGRYRGSPGGDGGGVTASFGIVSDGKAKGSLEKHRVSNSSSITGQDIKAHRFSTQRPPNIHRSDGMNDHNAGTNWWKFWQPPPGGFATPVPEGHTSTNEFPFNHTGGGRESCSTADDGKQRDRGFWSKMFSFFESESTQSQEYPMAYNKDYKENVEGVVWETYLRAKDRPTHRLPNFSWTPSFWPGLPLLNKKVDTIYWCRKELARLNLEIEIDQKHPEKFPVMNSAFIQFNCQVAAHMACQSVTHHVPKHMAPRIVEISPKDVIWENMSIRWWEQWLRTSIVVGIVSGMTILWAFPVAWTASLAQISQLGNKYSWLHWLNKIPSNVLSLIAGALPAVVLGILLSLVPKILRYLAMLQGPQTGTQQQAAVQKYYFAFLFVQVFLVVSISGGALAAILSTTDINTITSTLANQLPKAANYFFSYMILQALSTSAATLLQLITLVSWYVWPKIKDNTAREKWARNTKLPKVTWGTFYPVYTNFACIALIYSIVAPIIVIFAIITFSLLWIAHRYNMLYVVRFELDTGGLLYPRAINQTFTGLYVMELCLIGLFFLVEDENSHKACVPQGGIMIVCMIFTVLYQFLLNKSFGPLINYLPITFEDEAVVRDEAFQRAQARYLGLHDDTDDTARLVQGDAGIELDKLDSIHKPSKSSHPHEAPPRRRRKFHRDLEAQKKISNALYGGFNDEIEYLTPEERDVLVKHAFQHYALRARTPTVWIPRDDIGVSDDEIKRTREFAGKNIWISNVGAALDGNCRVVYGRNPPDFSEVDLINL